MAVASATITRQVVLRRGETFVFRAPCHSVVVCSEGSVRRTERIARGDDALPLVVDVLLRRGESHAVENGAVVTLAAESDAQLLCLLSVRPWRVFAARLLQGAADYVMMTNIRRGVEQSGSSSGS